MTKVRVVRLLEYTYDSAGEAMRDRELWQVERVTNFGTTTVRSAVLPPNIFDTDAVDLTDDAD